MKSFALMVALFAVQLGAAPSWADPFAQDRCDATRIGAWRAYSSCINTVVAKNARGDFIDEFALFARCRHAYFTKWARFQSPTRRPPLIGSTCIGSRFTDNIDGTVTDNLSGLVWEKKRNLD